MSQELEKGLVDLIGGVATCTPRLRQPPTFPVLLYQRISTVREEDIGGNNVGVTEATIQVDCIEETYAAAKALADSVRAILHTYQGAWGTLICRYCRLQTENDFHEQEGDKVTHSVTQRYQVWTNMT